MAFASGPVTFRRFMICGKFHNEASDALIQALRDHAFGQSRTAPPDGIEIGWIAPTHLFDADITDEKIVYDQFLYFQMRIDRTKAPASIIRSYTRIEEQAEQEAAGKPYLNKQQRADARDRAVARAEKEEKACLYRRITAVPVLIDLSLATVYFGNLSALAGDCLITLFRDTFDAALEPAASDTIAHRIMTAAGDPRSVEDAKAWHLIQPPQIEGDNGFPSNDRTFLGREFLTWLWYQTSDRHERFPIGQKSLAVTMSQTMHLQCDFGMTGSDAIRCENPANAPEARAALPLGKQPTKAGLVLGTQEAEYTFVLDGPRFNVSGLRLPDPESEQNDPRARLEERFAHVTQAAGLLDMLFGLYLGRRAASDWSDEFAAVKSWATGAPQLKLRIPATAVAP